MKLGDFLKRATVLDPNMEMNDLRSCVTTDADEIEALRQELDNESGTWEEYAAKVGTRVVVPMLLEIRDLLLLPATAKAWLKPAEFARKVAEEVSADRARGEEELSKTKAEFEAQLATTRSDFDKMMESLTAEHNAQMEHRDSEHKEQVAANDERHVTELGSIEKQRFQQVEELTERLRNSESGRERERREAEELADASRSASRCEIGKVQGAVPGKQAAAVVEALRAAADKAEAMARMRTSRIVKKKKWALRDSGLDSAMLRVEADGLLLAARRMRKMADEVGEQGCWPIKFTDDDEVIAPDLETEATEEAIREVNELVKEARCEDEQVAEEA